MIILFALSTRPQQPLEGWRDCSFPPFQINPRTIQSPTVWPDLWLGWLNRFAVLSFSLALPGWGGCWVQQTAGAAMTVGQIVVALGVFKPDGPPLISSISSSLPLFIIFQATHHPPQRRAGWSTGCPKPISISLFSLSHPARPPTSPPADITSHPQQPAGKPPRHSARVDNQQHIFAAGSTRGARELCAW